MAFDPFKIAGPTCISFSGGRTSAYMLWRVLQSNGGLPADAVVCFANTGKEDEATLRFVRDCGERWGVPITWLEYGTGPTSNVVNFDAANRVGAPFEAVIAQRSGTLPNPISRYCSSELKTRTMHRHIRQALGWDDWETLIGIRADEPRRAAKFRFNPHPETKAEYVRIPLVDAFVTAADVGAFWRSQPFDLDLPNNNGKTMHGNCDLCFLKPAAQVASLITEKPDRAIWWMHQEATSRATGAGRFFRDDRPSYAQMLKFSQDQRDMFDPEEEAIACFCGD